MRIVVGMATSQPDPKAALSGEIIHAFDDVFGVHAGFRPAHAKGILLTGQFTPTAEAAKLTRAPHMSREHTPVTVRFSNSTGIPAIPDNDPNSMPRGVAIRFHLAEHKHTDIIAHSENGFPTHTAEEFLEMLRAIKASGPDAPHPTPIEQFLGAHPAALRFVTAPKHGAVSFLQETYFGVNAHRFVNSAGEGQYVRYRVHPEGENAYLSDAEAAQKSPDFLFDEVKERLAKGPARLRVAAQLAAEGDVVNDATVIWPEERSVVELGVVELTAVAPNNAAEQQHIIFDPIARVDGIEASGDPLLEPRASVYLMSGRRRRKG